MTLQLEFLGATGRVTGSMYAVRTQDHCVLLECGLAQGGRKEEESNRDAFPMPIDSIDAVILSHAHIDHSGRVPLLVKRGYEGPIYTQNASRALCEIMLPDSGYLNEKDAEWQNKKLRAKGRPLVEPLYTRADAEATINQFRSMAYNEPTEIVPGLTLELHDAGHILGSSIVDLTQGESGEGRKLVFSGDLGFRDAPVMESPARLTHADAVLMESTYGDRLHRPFEETIAELSDVFASARSAQGNILIPAFTVGRTQDLLYLMAEHYDDWGLDNWQIYLDSPMAIEATSVYSKYRHLYGAKLFGPESSLPDLPNFHATRSTEESMSINEVGSGAIIIAGSGMCTGGRILHHLKNNIWRPECHLVIVGFQAYGTLGRRIVDGSKEIRLWGDNYALRAQVHTVGGLSAHADQADLINWYQGFENQPPVFLVHGEPAPQQALKEKIEENSSAVVSIAEFGQRIEL